ncbi:MAG: CAP domain-containing protein [Anaerolineae bacterium]|nr:CAP domain-containing protein [Anaerolineae bacterium]
MGFGRRKRPSDDDTWAIDDDDWLSLDDDGHAPTTKPIKVIIVGVTAVVLMFFCSKTLWSFWAEQQINNLLPSPEQTVAPVTSFDFSAAATSTPALPPATPATTALSTTIPITTSIPTPTVSGQQLEPAFDAHDPVVLAALMLELVNTARQENSLAPVSWDTTAVLAGQRHAEDMVQANYFSHWNREGLGPDHRYTLAGGQHAVMENLHAFSYTYDDGQGAPIEDWAEVIHNAHTGLMNSPGHRDNILDPAHTHVGIGMAYNAETGQFRLAQEFTNQYGRLSPPLPSQAAPGDTIIVRGHLTGNNLSNPLLNLAYEPLPTPMSQETLNRTSTYQSAAQSITTRQIGLVFDENVILDNHAPAGLYHIRLFVDVAGEQALVVDHVITVR